MDFDQRLQRAQEQMARQKRIHAMLDSLRHELNTLKTREKVLSRARIAEQKDVDRLEGRSLAAFFYGVVRKKDDKLDKERKEAYAAAVKHDTVVREIEDIEQSIRRLADELAALGNSEQQYADALAVKMAHLKQTIPQYAARISALDDRITACQEQQRQMDEATVAGNAALDTVNAMLSSLDSAEDWGTWDMLGGGMVTDLFKHSHLDEAQNKVEQLQVELRHFATELGDVTIEADLQVRIDGFLRFADYFFDGLFADWAVLDHIQTSAQQISSTKGEIEKILDRLAIMRGAAEKERVHLQAEREECIILA